jgi:ketosteroid isomerase-like protein
MPPDQIDLVRRAFAAFTERDVEGFLAVLDEEIEFLAVGTTRLLGKSEAYRGHEGIRRYFEDVARVWQELRVLPARYRSVGPYVLVLGSVYARDREGNLTDVPTGWIWKERQGKLVWGRAYGSREDALQAMKTGEPDRAPDR